MEPRSAIANAARGQYVDAYHKLRIVQIQDDQKQPVSVLTFPKAPLRDVPVESAVAVHPVTRQEDLDGLVAKYGWTIEAAGQKGIWVRSSFLGRCYVALSFSPRQQTGAPHVDPPPISEEEKGESQLDQLNRFQQVANLYKQAAIFLYSIQREKSTEHLFLVDAAQAFGADRDRVPQQLSLDDRRLFARATSGYQLIVPSPAFERRLRSYLLVESRRHPQVVAAQKYRTTVPKFFETLSDFNPQPSSTELFSSPQSVRLWLKLRRENPERRERGKPLCAEFRPSESDLESERFFLAEIENLAAKKESTRRDEQAAAAQRRLDVLHDSWVEPYFYRHYRVEQNAIGLVQNVPRGEKELAFRVAVLWKKHKVNFGPTLSRLQYVWDLSSTPLLLQQANVIVYSAPDGVLFSGDRSNPRDAVLLRYLSPPGPPRYAAWLPVHAASLEPLRG